MEVANAPDGALNTTKATRLDILHDFGYNMFEGINNGRFANLRELPRAKMEQKKMSKKTADRLKARKSEQARNLDGFFTLGIGHAMGAHLVGQNRAYETDGHGNITVGGRRVACPSAE